MKHTIACLNGRFLRADRAALPVADRGFRFGDGVFETIRLTNGVPYQWELHLARLTRGLAALRIPAPSVEWASVARTLIKKNRATNGFLRLSISRGSDSVGYFPGENCVPNWVMEYLPARPLPTAAYRVWASTITRPPLSALPVNSKLAHGIGSTLALLEAKENNCDEALLLSSHGLLSSAASANIFWLKGKALFTPALSTGCLDGTTRAAVMRLSTLPIHEIDADISALETADALFLTNTRFGVWPVSEIAPLGFKFNEGHPLIAQLQQLLSNDYSNNNKEISDDWENYK